MLFIVFCFIFAVDDNMATFNWSRCREQEASECSAKKRDICTTLPSPKDQGSVQRRKQKSVRTRRDGWLQETCLPSQQGRCTSALSVTVKACMRPVQAQVRPHPSMKQESWGETSPLPKKLLATESHWGRESQFPLRVQPAMFQWRPRVQEPMGSINCTWRVETKQQQKKNHKVRWQAQTWGGSGPGGIVQRTWIWSKDNLWDFQNTNKNERIILKTNTGKT